MKDTVKVLFLASDPFRDRASLRLDEEVRAIEHALRGGHARDGVELVSHFATRTRDLQDALLRHHPQVVHFAGHGEGTGVLYLGDEYGRPRPVGKEALAKLFGLLCDRVRVVILNGCDTRSTVEALGEVVDYAVGMNRPLTDPSAIVFARAFYGALAMGETVRASFGLAVNQLELEENPEAATPVLRIRSGVDPAAALVGTPAAPARAGGGGAQPAGAGQTNTFERFDGDDVLIENLPGSGDGNGQVNRFGDTTVRGFTLRNGGPR